MSMKKINYYLLLGTLIAPWVIVAPNAHAENNQSRQGFIAKPGARSAPSVSLQQAINSFDMAMATGLDRQSATVQLQTAIDAATSLLSHQPARENDCL